MNKYEKIAAGSILVLIVLAAIMASFTISTFSERDERPIDDLRSRIEAETQLLRASNDPWQWQDMPYVENHVELWRPVDDSEVSPWYLTVYRTNDDTVERIVFRPTILVDGRGEITEIRIEGHEVIVEVMP